MPFFVTCGCGQQMVVADELAGSEVRCSGCDTRLTLPSVLSPPTVLPSTASEGPLDPTRIVIRTHVETPRKTVDPDQQRARMVAAGLVVLACVGLVPIVVSWLLTLDTDATRWERWASAVVWLCLLEVCYAVYVWQLADWSAMRVVSWMMLLVAGAYAMVAAIRGLAAEGNRVTAYWDLDGNVFSSSQEFLWCFLMVVLTGLLSYLAGASSVRWARATGPSAK